MLTAFAILLGVTALLAYVNERFLHFPTTAGTRDRETHVGTGLMDEQRFHQDYVRQRQAQLQ
ncbi:hypothetical protein CTI14_44025, partial [Methylobacterium radiotolerans]